MRGRIVGVVSAIASTLASCHPPPPRTPDAEGELIARGREIFFNETFQGNGRTCGTCHPAENEFTLDPAFIATLPPTDPLFVAEFTPALRRGFENPRLMREFGLILENLDGFDDLENRFTMRGVPHTLGLCNTVRGLDRPRTGWSGDGAPGDGSLRSFAVGAVIQHFTKTLDRIPGIDFRLPTDEELDALEAFQLSLGRQTEISLPLPLKGTVASRGQKLFFDPGAGKCNLCHVNAGATALFGGSNVGNANFNTGVEDLPDQPARLSGEPAPRDDGLGVPGDGTFNTPSLIEAASTGPFFHNNAIETIEGAVAFYDGEAFNRSPAGRFLASVDPDSVGIDLDATQIVAIAAFLRVLNALESIRASTEFLEGSLMERSPRREAPARMLRLAVGRIDDAIEVLGGGGLHPLAVIHLRRARESTMEAVAGRRMKERVREAIQDLEHARDNIREHDLARGHITERAAGREPGTSGARGGGIER